MTVLDTRLPMAPVITSVRLEFPRPTPEGLSSNKISLRVRKAKVATKLEVLGLKTSGGK